VSKDEYIYKMGMKTYFFEFLWAFEIQPHVTKLDQNFSGGQGERQINFLFIDKIFIFHFNFIFIHGCM